MKSFRLIPVLLLGICPGPRLHAEMVDGILAVINDTVITRQEVEDKVASSGAIESLRRQYSTDPQAFQQKLTAALNDGLEQLVERQLILHSFDTEGYRLPESVVDELVQDRIRERYTDRITLMKTLQAQGETYEQFRQDVRDQYIVSALRSKNVAQEIVISPFKVENYYRAHQNDFKVEDEIRLRMIVLNKISPDDTNTVARAREIRAQILAGASFAEMASVYSQDAQHNQGGDRGWIARSVLRKDLGDVAFALQPGQVSEVIELPDACYLMQVEQTRPAHVKSLNEVRDDIERNLRAQEQARLEKQWIDRLKAKTFRLYF